MKDIIKKLGITPGPWKGYYETSEGNGTIDALPDHKHVALRLKNKNDIRLITTAPEMFLSIIGMVDCAETNSMNKAAMLLELMKEVIKKATGKTYEEIKELSD